MGSKSARLLKNTLPFRVLLKKNHTSFRRKRETLLNWGNSRPGFDLTGLKIINRPEAIRLSSNKLTALQRLKEGGVTVPEFTTSRDVALQWIKDGRKAIARTILSSHSGNGIVVIKEALEMVYAPLYTRYFKKENEFRVHVFMGKVIDYTEKKAKLDKGPGYNPLIRTNNNGWVYCRSNILDVPQVKEQALKAVKTLGLDFGAVDVMWNGAKAVVLEVNTAPGLCDSTAAKYAQAIVSNGIV